MTNYLHKSDEGKKDTSASPCINGLVIWKYVQKYSINCNGDDDYLGGGDEDNEGIDDSGDGGGDDKDKILNHLGVSHTGYLSIDLSVKE